LAGESKKVGERVVLKIVREGEQIDVSVTLAAPG
jgi:S1-C subfamily serine protease